MAIYEDLEDLDSNYEFDMVEICTMYSEYENIRDVVSDYTIYNGNVETTSSIAEIYSELQEILRFIDLDDGGVLVIE
ncbi:MAG: hypothetical protein RBR71_13895 [Gudongella sp.]|nr:hypothetical protein [Gudongella sp.]